MSLEKNTQYLKITEKVSFNIASKASFVYILSRQKFIENTKNGQFCQFLKCDILSNFQTMCTVTKRKSDYSQKYYAKNVKVGRTLIQLLYLWAFFREETNGGIKITYKVTSMMQQEVNTWT